MGTLAFIGLGSNLGDRKANLDDAIAALRVSPGITVLGVSSYHESRPVGGPSGQGPFLNAAASLETTLDPFALLHRHQEIEAGLGRVRTVRWGERTLDLDLLLFGRNIISNPELTVPHPRLGVRRFVLAPLDEIAPEVRDPLTRSSIRGLLANLDRRPSCLALQGWWTRSEKTSLYRRIVQELDGIGLSVRDRLQNGDQIDPMLTMALEPDGLLEQLATWLDRGRWHALGEQWLITDFALRELAGNAVVHWGSRSKIETSLFPFIVSIERHEQSLVKPTFVVCEPQTSSTLLTGYSSLGTPCLRLESTTADEQISEILSACQATRS
jgi:2-amino-4-hydroxy-6-hydroxymethyldihydropteridine diphosphokinase